MKKIYNILILIVIILLCGFVFYSIIKPKKMSKIIIKETKIKQLPSISTSTVKYEIFHPIASLPKKTKKTKYDKLEGKIISIPADTSNPNSPQITVLLKTDNNEVVLIKNAPYVAALKKLYFEKEVTLLGKWQKETTLYGRKYKSFWVEDYSLKNNKGE